MHDSFAPQLCLRLTLLFGCIVNVPLLTSATPIEAITPAPRLQAYEWMPLARWFTMHAEDVAIAESGEARIVFLGDSITEGWAGQAIWRDSLAPRGAVNFGIGGDKTQNVLWRLENGNAGSLAPEVVVILIGTNNFGLGQTSAPEVALGVRTVVLKARETFPQAKVLLFGIFPRGAEPNTPIRRQIEAVNTDLSSLHDGVSVFFEDIGARFLDPDGSLSPTIMPDFLHLSGQGYQIWAEAILPYLEKWIAIPAEPRP